MESTTDKGQTTMRTQTIPTTEQMEKRIAFSADTITSNTIKPTVQQQKNTDMETLSLFPHTTGHTDCATFPTEIKKPKNMKTHLPIRSNSLVQTLFTKQLRFFALLIAMFLLSGTMAMAAIFTATTNGNWNLGATWGNGVNNVEGSGYPGASDIANIPVGVTITIPGSFNAKASQVNMNSTSADGNANISLTNSNSSLTVGGDFKMKANPSYNSNNDASKVTLNGGSITISGNLTMDAGFRSSGPKKQTSQLIFTSGGNVTVTGSISVNKSSTSLSLIDMSGGGTLKVGAGLTVDGTFTSGTGTVNFNGTGAQTIPIGSYTFNNIQVNNTYTSGATLGAAIASSNVTGNLSVQSGILNNGGNGVTLASGKSFSVSNDATFNLTGSSSMVSISGGGTKTFGTTSTVNYSGAAQTVTAETYGNLILSGTSSKIIQNVAMTIAGNLTLAGSTTATAQNNLSISGDVTLGSGTTFTAGAFTHNVKGDWTNNGGTFTNTGSTINFNGSAAQNIGGSAATTFNNLILNNGAGVVLSGTSVNTTVSGTLTLTSGVVTTNANTLIVSNNATAAISRTNGWVAGNLRRTITNTGSPTYAFLRWNIFKLYACKPCF